MRGVLTLFPPYSTAAGARTTVWELAEGGQVDDLLRDFRERHPKMADALEVALVSVNDRYAPGRQLLKDGDEVTLFPPVGGGSSRMKDR